MKPLSDKNWRTGAYKSITFITDIENKNIDMQTQKM